MANKKYATAFGEALAKQLEKRSTNQRTLAAKLGSSPSYVNHLLAGRKTASASIADTVADELCLPEKERIDLHRAAARDAGFKLDLTKPVKR
jgi:cyanate lyase